MNTYYVHAYFTVLPIIIRLHHPLIKDHHALHQPLTIREPTAKGERTPLHIRPFVLPGTAVWQDRQGSTTGGVGPPWPLCSWAGGIRRLGPGEGSSEEGGLLAGTGGDRGIPIGKIQLGLHGARSMKNVNTVKGASRTQKSKEISRHTFFSCQVNICSKRIFLHDTTAT